MPQLHKTKPSFFSILNIDVENRTINISPNTLLQLGAIQRLVKKGKLDLDELLINQAYLLDCQAKIIGYLNAVAEDLKLFTDPSCPEQHSVEYDCLDYFDGLVKSATSNNVATWEELGFKNSDDFNETIEVVKDCISQRLEQELTDTQDSGWEYFKKDNLPGYEDDDSLEVDEEEIDGEKNHRQKLIEERVFDPELGDEILNDQVLTRKVCTFLDGFNPSFIVTLSNLDPDSLAIYDQNIDQQIAKAERTCCFHVLKNQQPERIIHNC